MCSWIGIHQWKKRLRKIRMIFDIENWLWKSNFGTFWQLAINPKLNNFLWVYWFLCKNVSNFVPPVWKLHNTYCHTLQINNLTRNLDGKPAESWLEFEILLTFLVQMTSANVCAGAARKLISDLRFLAKILFFTLESFLT